MPDLLVTSGVVGHWKMNDNAPSPVVLDSSGYGHDGIAQQNTSILTTAGKLNSALSFDGVTDYIDCGNPSQFNFTTRFTIEVWIKCSNLTGREYKIICKGGATGWEFDFQLNPDCLEFIVYRTNGNSHAEIANWDIALDDNEWHYLVGVYWYGNFIKIYIDGVERGSSTSFVQTKGTSSEPLLIGKRSDGNHFRGVIDEIVLYNRALTAQEILKRYNAGNGTESLSHCNLIETTENFLAALFIAVVDLNISDNVLVTEQVNVLDLSIEVGVVTDFISVSETLEFLFSLYNLTASEDINITEVRLLKIPLEVFERITVAESAVALIPILEIATKDITTAEEFINLAISELFIEGFENIILFEHIGFYLPELNVGATELLNVGEHVSIIDLVVELIGIDQTFISESVSLFPDLLYKERYENIFIEESIHIYPTELYLEIDEVISLLEISHLTLPELYLEELETVAINEFSESLIWPLVPEVFDLITTTEKISFYFDSWALGVFEPTIVIEDVKILDLVIELGPVFEEIALFDRASLTDIIIELALIIDDIAVNEVLILNPDVLYVGVSEELGITDVATITDIIIEMGIVWDEININEFAQVLDITIELEAIDTCIVEEIGLTFLPILNIIALEAISIEEYSNIHDIVVELGIFQDIGLGEKVVLTPDPLYISVTQNISIEEYADVWDIIIELFAEDGVGVNDYIITESYARVYDWASVTGALVDFIGALEVFAIYITELFIKHYEVIDLVEYLRVMSIMRPLFYQEIFINEFLGIDLRIEALLIDEISVEDFGTLYYPIYKLIFDEVDIEEFQLSKVLYWDLFPRIFIVQPRHRIFICQKKAFPHRYWDYEMRRWHRFEKEESYK